MEMKRESDFVRYLFKWLLLIFTVFAVVSICFNLVTYMREKQYYSRIIEQEQQERINYLSRNINEELTNLKITANMAVKEEIVQDLYCRYDYVNSYERSKLMEAIRKRCMEIDNLNSFVSSSWLYLPEKNLKIGRDGYDFVEEEAYAFVLENKENELISIKDGKAYIMELSPRGGGNRLSECLRYATGVDMITNMVKYAVGLPVDAIEQKPYDGCWAEIILHSDKPGIFKELWISDDIADNVVERDLWIQEGTHVGGFEAANEAIGTLVLKLESQERIEKILGNQSRYVKVKLA